MSYRQKVTYQEKNTFANKASTKVKTSNNAHRDENKLDEEESASPVGPAKDTYGYIGFTSQDS
ncbi:hypothetical protein [Pelosinus sp. IPA-1]|uniref:hypothetical protein n=1 Tax=Pelosinus sp. IPA-1 TaxID=3029569 RepID=UPI00243629EB|nr:hypothetical protein [Pelosinus sp. IPA-1]GMA98728.1 hypothetical protein PIPA1_15280 [Pelosinus sp. IPA-1]